MTTSKQFDALTLTELVITELTNAGLSLDKILSQKNKVMSGKHSRKHNKNNIKTCGGGGGGGVTNYFWGGHASLCPPVAPGLRQS